MEAHPLHQERDIGIAISSSESNWPLSLSVGYCSNDSMDYKNVTGKHDSSSLAWLECCHKWQHSLPLFQEHRTVSVQRIRRCRRIVLPISSNHEGYTRDRTLLEDSSHCACRYERKRIRVHQRNLTETHRTCIKAMKVLAQFSQKSDEYRCHRCHQQ